MIYNLERREYTVQKTTDNMVAQFPFLLSFCIFFSNGDVANSEGNMCASFAAIDIVLKYKFFTMLWYCLG